MGVYIDTSKFHFVKKLLINAGVSEDKIFESIGRSSADIGEKWQQDFSRLSLKYGYRSEKVIHKPYDFLVSGIKVQCKGSGRTTVSIGETTNSSKKKGCRYKIGSYDILAVRCLMGIFIIPEYFVRDSKNPGFLKTYFNPKLYLDFKDQWELLS